MGFVGLRSWTSLSASHGGFSSLDSITATGILGGRYFGPLPLILDFDVPSNGWIKFSLRSGVTVVANAFDDM